MLHSNCYSFWNICSNIRILIHLKILCVLSDRLEVVIESHDSSVGRAFNERPIFDLIKGLMSVRHEVTLCNLIHEEKNVKDI